MQTMCPHCNANLNSNRTSSSESQCAVCGAKVAIDSSDHSETESSLSNDSTATHKSSASKEGLPQPQDEFWNVLDRLTPKVYVTKFLVIINVCIYLMMVAQGVHFFLPQTHDMILWQANHGPSTYQGEIWRLFTSLFLHVGILHLALNMWVLWDIGDIVERLVGHLAFLTLYLVSGIVGGMASIWWRPDVISAGASGAIFGVFGAFVGFGILRKEANFVRIMRKPQKSIFIFLVVNLLLGFFIPFVDMGAHLGGLIAGFCCGMFLSQPIHSTLSKSRLLPNLFLIAAWMLLLPTLGYIVLLVQNPILVPLQRAALALKMHQPDRALQEASKVRKLVPQSSRASLLMGEAFLQLEQFQSAVSVLSQTIRIEPDNTKAYLLRSDANLKLHRFSQVIQDCNLVLEQVSLQQDSLRKQATRKESASWKAKLNRGAAFTMLQQYEPAMADLNQVIEHDPSSAVAYSYRSLLKSQQQDFLPAMEDANQAIELDPNLAIAYEARAVILIQQESYKQALTNFDQAIQLEPTSTDYHYKRGVLHQIMQHAELAKQDFYQVLALNPNYLPALNKLAFLEYQTGEYEKAKEHFATALKRNPTDVALMARYAWMLATCPIDVYRNGKLALHWAKRANVLTQNKDPRALSALAAAYAENGNFSAAIYWQLQAIQRSSQEEKVAQQELLEQYQQFQPARDLMTSPKITSPKITKRSF